jgi:hypothetical protein
VAAMMEAMTMKTVMMMMMMMIIRRRDYHPRLLYGERV